MKEPVRVVVVDDHEIVRAGVRSMLDREPDINVIGAAADGREALDLLGRISPDVVLVDYRLPGMSGVELCGEIARLWPNVRIIMLTSFLEDAVIRNSLAAGADAYVYKDIEGRDLKRAIRKVMCGESVLDSKVAPRVMKWARKGSSRGPRPLSGREVQVLKLASRGLSNLEIAQELNVTVNTVKTWIARSLRKLACSNRSEAVTVAAERGLL